MKLFLQQIFSTVLKWVCQIYPKDKNKILIGIPNASFYNDNSKYFFEFLWKKENKDFDFFLLTKNKKLFTKLRTKFGNHIIYAFSTQALLVYLKAKFVLLSNGNGDIFPFTPTNKKQIVINMWHAITFKNVGYLSKSKTLSIPGPKLSAIEQNITWALSANDVSLIPLFI